MEVFINNFVLFFAMIDPIGSMTIFLALTANYSDKLKHKVAYKAIIISAIVLLAFIALGEIILNQIGVPLSAFRIAGGVILFLFALQMVFDEHDSADDTKAVEKSTDIAIFPLAFPSIAGPGPMLSTVILTENARYSISEQAITSLAMLSVLAITLALLLASKYIGRLLGKSGSNIITRVMGLILASIAITSIIEGLKETFSVLA